MCARAREGPPKPKIQKSQKYENPTNMTNNKKYAVEFAINHIKEHQNQNQHHFLCIWQNPENIFQFFRKNRFLRSVFLKIAMF